MDEEAKTPGSAEVKAGRPAPEPATVGFAVGVDKEANAVLFDLTVTGGEKAPVKVRLYLNEAEVAELCKTLLNAALEIKKGRGPVVIPSFRSNGAIKPTLHPKR